MLFIVKLSWLLLFRGRNDSVVRLGENVYWATKSRRNCWTDLNTRVIISNELSHCPKLVIIWLSYRELLRTKDFDGYLTFCKTQILGCNRKESKFSSKVCMVKWPFVYISLTAFHKDSTKELELIFTDFLSKTSQPKSNNSQASGPDSANPGSSKSSAIIEPRIIPLDFSLPGLGQACTAYYLQPAKFNFHELPRSYQFVLSECSSLVETDTKTLCSCVKHLETQLNRQLTFIKNLEKEYSEDTGMVNV